MFKFWSNFILSNTMTNEDLNTFKGKEEALLTITIVHKNSLFLHYIALSITESEIQLQEKKNF